MLTNTSTFNTYSQLQKSDVLTKVSLFLQSKKEKNNEIIKLRTYKEVSDKFTRIRKEFDNKRTTAQTRLRDKVWQALEASREVVEMDFGTYFIGLKGDIYKEYKNTEMEMKQLIEQLGEDVYKQLITQANSLKRSRTISKEFHSSLKEMILKDLSKIVTDAKDDRLTQMLRLKKEVYDFVKRCGKIEKERGEQFGRELKAEIHALTR